MILFEDTSLRNKWKDLEASPSNIFMSIIFIIHDNEYQLLVKFWINFRNIFDSLNSFTIINTTFERISYITKYIIRTNVASFYILFRNLVKLEKINIIIRSNELKF